MLGEILLVVTFREVEGRRRQNLRGDRVEALLGCFRCAGLRVGSDIDAGPILSAEVIALAHALRRIMALEDHLEQIVIAHALRIEDHEHGLVVPGAA
jgi:hypothetical protein